MTVLIFANGDIADVAWIRPYLGRAKAIIAADGGTRHVLALGCVPDVVIGDMDSISPQARQELETAVTRFVTYPTAKDETDLELALLYAAGEFAEEMLVFGAFGGRIDQLLANAFLLAHPALHGRRVQLVDQYQRAWLIEAGRQAEIRGVRGDKVSLIACGGDVYVEATGGLRWPLHEEWLPFGPARGLSNEMTADLATVTVRSGQLLCVHTRQEWQR